ncbi:MAG: hypothetical protein AAF225_14780 [Pseudomonadota bacterium]
MLPDSPRFSKELHGCAEGLIEGFERVELGPAFLGLHHLFVLWFFVLGFVGGEQALAWGFDHPLDQGCDLFLDAAALLPDFLALGGLARGAGVPDIREHRSGHLDERGRGLHAADEGGDVAFDLLLTDGCVVEGTAVGLAGGIAVMAARRFGEGLSNFQCNDDQPVQELVPAFAVKAFAVPVLPQASRFDVVGLNTDRCQPFTRRRGDKYGPVVGSDVLRWAMTAEKFPQIIERIPRAEHPLDTDRQPLSGEPIYDVEHAEDPIMMGPILDEDIAPSPVFQNLHHLDTQASPRAAPLYSLH